MPQNKTHRHCSNSITSGFPHSETFYLKRTNSLLFHNKSWGPRTKSTSCIGVSLWAASLQPDSSNCSPLQRRRRRRHTWMSVDTSLATNGGISEKEKKKSSPLLSLTEVMWHFPSSNCNVSCVEKPPLKPLYLHIMYRNVQNLQNYTFCSKLNCNELKLNFMCVLFGNY